MANKDLLLLLLSNCSHNTQARDRFLIAGVGHACIVFVLITQYVILSLNFDSQIYIYIYQLHIAT